MRSTLRTAWALAPLLAAGCAGSQRLATDDLAAIDTVAVTVRLTGGPTVALTPENAPGQDAQRLAREAALAIRDAVGRPELTVHVRDLYRALIERGTTLAVADPVAVDTALGSFLVDEDPELRDYTPLRAMSVDAVIELTLEDYGIRDPGPPGTPRYYISLEGRMVRVGDDPGARDVVWRHRAVVGEEEQAAFPADIQALLLAPARIFRERFDPVMAQSTRALFDHMQQR